jgi:presenilin-like A22 family membrane protease
VLAWLLSRSSLSQGRQVLLVALAVIGYAGLFVVVLLRTAAGLGPFDLRSGSVAGYLVAVVLLAIPVVVAVADVSRRGAAPSR